MTTRVVAHRTVPLDARENSLEGIAAAARLGADVVEVDARRSFDGTAVLLHDPWLGRVQKVPLPLRWAPDSLLHRLKVPTLVDALERAISQAALLSLRLISWEQRWSLANLVANHPDTLGPSLVRQLESGRAMTLADYRECLLLREHARQCLAALATQCDALVSLNACGAAPIAADIRDTRYPTGDVSFACASSLLGAPAINVPLMAVDGLPLGLQVMGLPHGDAAITAIGTWMLQSLRHPG